MPLQRYNRAISRLPNSARTEEPALGIVTTLLNRQADGEFAFPKDNWYLIAPIGEHPHTESGFVQVVDAESVAAMANSIKGKELLVDFDHESWNSDKRTTAAGWIQNLEARDDGLWAQIRWSGSGKSALKNGDYRFISPVWTFANCHQIDETHVRPLALSDAGLTNRPNLQGLPALSNREGDPHPQLAADSADQKKEPTMKKLLALLGLSADAAEDSAVEAVTKLQNRAETAEKAVEPLKKQNTDLTTSNRELLTAQVESDLDTAGVEGEERETFKAQLMTNRAGTLPLLAALAKAKGNAKSEALTNRAAAKTPDKKGGNAPTDDATRQAQMEDAIANAKGKSFEERFENARRSKPELFKQEAATE